MSGSRRTTGHNLDHVDTWIFDLDNTLYADGELFLSLIGDRMTDYVMRLTGLGRAEAHALQKRYLADHGATLAGLVVHHGVDAQAFLDEVHEVSLDSLTPQPRLRAALGRLPGRRLVFTNGSRRHAERVLDHLRLADLFEGVFHVEAADMRPKPEPEVYDRLVLAHAITARRAALFEDSERNLAPAARLGMTTVLVGPHAESSTAPFVDYRAAELAPFLDSVRVRN